MVQKIFNTVARKMSKTMMIALLAIGIALFSFNACTDANAQIGNRVQSERWEYKTLHLQNVGTRDGVLTYGGGVVTDRLNNLGAEGWQLVSTDGSSRFFFKRRL